MYVLEFSSGGPPSRFALRRGCAGRCGSLPLQVDVSWLSGAVKRTRELTLNTEVLHLAHQEPRQNARGDEGPHRLSDLGLVLEHAICNIEGWTNGSRPLAETEEAHDE